MHKIIVKGLEDDEYVLTEIETANGYVLLKDSIHVVITAADDATRPCTAYAKDWFDDFMEYKMVTESEDENDTGSGNNPGCFPYLLGAILILYVISKLFS